jgi:hypothetical protein
MATRRPVDDEELLERLDEEGEKVWTLEWDAGGPGAGGDEDYACRLEGRYYAVLVGRGETWGPYKTLEDAVEAGDLDVVTEATAAVRSSVMAAAEVAALLRPSDDEVARSLEPGEGWLEVNVEAYVYEDGEFRPATPEERAAEGPDG